MITFIQLKNGATEYLDKEMISKITNPVMKFTAISSLYVVDQKANNLFMTLKDNPVIKTLDVINDEGIIDDDLLLDALKAGMSNKPMSVNTGLLGTITVYPDDVEKLRSYLKAESAKQPIEIKEQMPLL